MASAAHPLLHELGEAQRLLKDSRTPRATAALQSAHDDILAELVCDLADAQKLRQLAATDKAKSLLDAVIKSLESALPAISALPTPLLLDPALDPGEIATARVDAAGLDTVMTNSFGFGGTNGSMLLSKYQG